MDQANKNTNFIEILGTRIDMVQIPDVIQRIEKWIAEKHDSNYICLANVNTVVESKKNNLLEKAMNSSSLSVCDGMPFVWIGRLKGFNLKRRVYGPELMDKFIEISSNKGYKNYFYGSTDEVCGKLIFNLKKKYRNLEVVGNYSPPFRPLTKEEGREVAENINSSGADVVWVGIGSPKQEIWMHEFKSHIKIPVMVGVGAAFDFFAGTKQQAPKWMRENGFEWLFRLLTEPKRLWKRYLIGNSIFLWLLFKELVCVNIFKKSKQYV